MFNAELQTLRVLYCIVNDKNLIVCVMNSELKLGMYITTSIYECMPNFGVMC